MKKLKRTEPKYLQKICVDCGNPFYVLRNHFKRAKRCLPCKEYHKREYMRNYQRRYREKNK